MSIQEHELYKQLRQIALDGNYTAAQVSNATKEQVAALLEIDADAAFWSGGNIGYFTAMKRLLALEIQATEDEADKEFLQNQLTGDGRVAVMTRFPDLEITKGRTDGKRHITLWLDGQTEELPLSE